MPDAGPCRPVSCAPPNMAIPITKTSKGLPSLSIAAPLELKLLPNAGRRTMEWPACLLQNPTPQSTVRRFLAGDLNVESALFEAFDLIGSEIGSAADCSLRRFRDHEINERGAANAG